MWERKLPFVISAYNCSVNTATGKSPFELVFGKTMAIPYIVSKQKNPNYTFDDYAHEIREYSHYAWNLAREKLI